ncbi:MAG: FAD:protein FMN transferase, partial [Acidimicrobiales bacterium]
MSQLEAVELSALGTTAVLVTWPGDAADGALEVLLDEIAAIDAAASRFRADSELTALNSSGGWWTPVSPLLLQALRVALVAARQTDGAVDPTVGVSMRLLGYDRDFGMLDPDGPPLIARLEAVPGWQVVQVDEAKGQVRWPAGVEVDLGATAKAFAAERAARRAHQATGAGVLVGLGGDIACVGEAPPGGWRVRVTDDHRGPIDAPGRDVAIASGGLATSSTTARAWRRGGEEIHHIVDPGTGRPAQGPWRTVSVAAGNCVDANTAATAAVVKGDSAPSWLAERRLPARLVAHD